MESKCVGYVWFSGRSSIGIVISFNLTTHKQQAFIHAVSGEDEQLDIKTIMDWGTKFPMQEAESLINKFGSWRMSKSEIKKLLESKVSTDSTENSNGSSPSKL